MFAEEFSDALAASEHRLTPPGCLEYIVLAAVSEEKVPSRAKRPRQFVACIANIGRPKEEFQDVHDTHEIHVCRGGRGGEIPLFERHLGSCTSLGRSTERVSGDVNREERFAVRSQHDGEDALSAAHFKSAVE